MWKTAVWPYFSTLFYQQGQCGKPALFNKDGKKENSQKFLHRNSIHNPQRLWKTLQTGVDICVDITDVILQILIAVNAVLYLTFQLLLSHGNLVKTILHLWASVS